MTQYNVKVSTGDFENTLDYTANSSEHAAFVAGMEFLAHHMDSTTPGAIIKAFAPDFFEVMMPHMVALAEGNYTVTVEEL